MWRPPKLSDQRADQEMHPAARGDGATVLNPRVRFVVVSVLFFASGCFEGAPGNAVLFCASDDDCPDGHACNVGAHLCASGADLDSPTLSSAVFVPAAARRGQSVVLTVSSNEALSDDPPQLTFAGGVSDPGFAASPGNGANEWRFALLVDDRVAAGTYRLVSLFLTDASGNTADVDVDAALVVDDTAPIVRNLIATGARSDVDGNNEFALTFDVSEALPPAGIEVQLGGLSTPDDVVCTARGALGVACSGNVTADSVADGRNALTLDLTDDAGNATHVDLDLDIDAAAPTVLTDTVVVSLRGAGGLPADVLAIGGDATITFVVDEELGADPVVVHDAAVVVTARVSVDGRRVTAVLSPGLDVAFGAYSVLVTLTDVVGHVATSTAALPAPFVAGLVVGAATEVCVSSTLVCPDIDGDGQARIVAGCAPPALIDCDDDDASSFVGGIEIPGDGHDNDCTGGDGAVDEATGIFLRVGADDAVADGSRARPFGTYLAAVAAGVLQAPKVLFASGDVDLGLVGLGVTLVGGFNADWVATGAPSPLRASSNPINLIGIAVVNVDAINPVTLSGRAMIVRSQVGPRVIMGGGAVAVDVTLGSDLLTVGPTRVVDVNIPNLAANGDLVAVRSRVLGASFVGTGASLTLVNSVLDGGITVSGGAFAAFHSSVLSDGGANEPLLADPIASSSSPTTPPFPCW